MTEREKFESECKKLGYTEQWEFFRRTHPNWYDEDNINDMWKIWQAATKAAVPEGWTLVPVEPTVEQFGGIARDIIQWMRFTESKNQHSDSLVKWLKDMGSEIPDWLYSESEINHLSKHVISKGTIAAIIYKAMLSAAPEVK